jgi:phospholipase D3/4
MIIVDEADFYLGSANLAWSALTEVKELGLVVEQCPLLALDALKIHKMYWEAAKFSTLPAQWSRSLDTIYNASNPARVIIGGEHVSVTRRRRRHQFESDVAAHHTYTHHTYT